MMIKVKFQTPDSQSAIELETDEKSGEIVWRKHTQGFTVKFGDSKVTSIAELKPQHEKSNTEKSDRDIFNINWFNFGVLEGHGHRVDRLFSPTGKCVDSTGAERVVITDTIRLLFGRKESVLELSFDELRAKVIDLLKKHITHVHCKLTDGLVPMEIDTLCMYTCKIIPSFNGFDDPSNLWLEIRCGVIPRERQST